VLALGSWALVGFEGLGEYSRLLQKLVDVEAANSYSALAMLETLGLSQGLSRALVALAGILLLGWAFSAARGSGDDRERDRRSLTLALAAALVLTPILWLHYLVLLAVPIALARPRLSVLWFDPLVMTLFEALGWYRGWPSGEGRSLASVAAVVALVFVGSLRARTVGSEEARGAPVRA